ARSPRPSRTLCHQKDLRCCLQLLSRPGDSSDRARQRYPVVGWCCRCCPRHHLRFRDRCAPARAHQRQCPAYLERRVCLGEWLKKLRGGCPQPPSAEDRWRDECPRRSNAQRQKRSEEHTSELQSRE